MSDDRALRQSNAVQRPRITPLPEFPAEAILDFLMLATHAIEHVNKGEDPRWPDSATRQRDNS